MQPAQALASAAHDGASFGSKYQPACASPQHFNVVQNTIAV